MDVGDLVVMNPLIEEDTDERGDTPGIVLGVQTPESVPQLGLILWPDGETENLYSDEVKVIGRRQC